MKINIGNIEQDKFVVRATADASRKTGTTFTDLISQMVVDK